MAQYKFFGNGPCSVPGVVEFKQFGQAEELPDNTALDILKAGGGILRAEDYDAIGFPMEMVRQRKRRSGDAYMALHMKALDARARLQADLEGNVAQQA